MDLNITIFEKLKRRSRVTIFKNTKLSIASLQSLKIADWQSKA